MSPWLFSEVATEKLAPAFPESIMRPPPWLIRSEWIEIGGVALAVVRIGMQTSLVGPGTLLGLQLRAVLQEPSPAFPVQVALHFCACAKLPRVAASASNKAARKNILVWCIFVLSFA